MRIFLLLFLLPGFLTSAVESYGRLPVTFERNEGQADPRAKFLSRGRSYALFLAESEVVLALGGEPASVVRMRFPGARRAPEIEGMEPQAGRGHYFRGQDPARWRTGIPHFARIRYRELWPGVDLVCYGREGQLEYDFVVAPGADPGRIRMALEGPQSIRIDEDGDLVLTLAGGKVRHRRPRVYQDAEGGRRPIQGRYVLAGKNRVGFAVADFDRSRPLVIDPVLAYSTYLGGNAADNAAGIAVDSGGNAYVVGSTLSTDFPTAAALRSSKAGDRDVFVAKLNPSGSVLVYSTYLGGALSDSAGAIAVDAAGNAYVTGNTASTDFPTRNPVQAAMRGSPDVFVAKLNPAGSALVYSTYLGGNLFDISNGIAVDSAGGAYVAGETSSDTFPTVNALQPSRAPGNCRFGDTGFILIIPCSDAFVSKLSPDGTRLEYSTYLGGRNVGFAGSGGDLGGDDFARAVAVDGAGNAYVTGRTLSGAFPTTPGSWRPTGPINEAPFAFVTKLSPMGRPAVYSTYLGPGEGAGIAVDAAGNAYVTGGTASNGFPVVGAAQGTRAGKGDAFVSKLNPAGAALVYSTYLGGAEEDYAADIAVDGSGSAYVTGTACSSNFPLANPLQAALGGGCDAFVAKLDANGGSLIYSTLLGGSAGDGGHAIAVDGTGNAYVTGDTSSTNFPTAAPLRGQKAAESDIFVARISDGPATPTVTSVSAASFRGPALAPESIAAAFGSGLATTTEAATSLPLPTTLGGTTVKITDSAGVERTAELFFVSPGQINFLIPRGTAPGAATVNVITGAGTTITGRLQIEAVAPSLFTANASGQGVAAALGVRASAGGAQSPVEVFRFDAAQGKSVAVPIDLGPESDQIILILFGTGIRGNSGLGNVRLRIAGVDCEVLYAGPQPDFTGLDQVNARLSRALAARGEVTVELTVDGKAANPVTIAIGGLPRISSLSPNVADPGQTIAAFSVAGDNLGGVTALEFSPAEGITVSNLRATTTAVTAQVAIAAGAAAGERSVAAVSPAGRSNALPFTVQKALLPGPRITSLNPSSGEAGQTIATFTISGENLGGVTALDFSPADGITVSGIQATATAVTARVAIAANAAAGDRFVTVASGAGRSNSLVFTIRTSTGPRITSINPSSGEAGQTIAGFVVSGENLGGVTALEFSPATGITVSIFQATASTVTAQVTIAASAAAGDRSVTAVSAAGRSNSVTFTVRAAAGLRITTLTPNIGALSQTVNLTIAGTGLAGATAVEFSPPDGVTVSLLQATATAVTARVVIAANAPLGDRQVLVVAGAARSNTLTFNIRETISRVPVISNVGLTASTSTDQQDVNVVGGFDFTDGDGDIRRGINFASSARLMFEFTSRGASCTFSITGDFLNRPGETAGRVTFNLTFVRPQSIIQGSNPVNVSLIDAAGRVSNRVEFVPPVWACGINQIRFSP